MGKLSSPNPRKSGVNNDEESLDSLWADRFRLFMISRFATLILQLIIYKALLNKGFLFVCHFAIAKLRISQQVSFLSEIQKSSQAACN